MIMNYVLLSYTTAVWSQIHSGTNTEKEKDLTSKKEEEKRSIPKIVPLRDILLLY